MPVPGAGERGDLVEIHLATESQDSTTGERALAWNLHALAWAQVLFPGTSEVFRVQQQVATVDAIFRMPWRDDVTPTETWSVVHAGRRYDVTGVVPTPNAPRRSFVDVYGHARAE